MLTAVVSGDKGRILTGLLSEAQTRSELEGLPSITLLNDKYEQILDVLHGRRVYRTITLSREN
jgi:hypothetical protein